MRSKLCPSLAVAAAVLLVPPLAAQAPRLVGPVYPGSVSERSDGDVAASATWRVTYLSRDPLGSVAAFYDAELGASRRKGESRLESDDPRIA